MSNDRSIQVSLTGNAKGEDCVRVKEFVGDWGVRTERVIWFGTYDELAEILEREGLTAEQEG